MASLATALVLSASLAAQTSHGSGGFFPGGSVSGVIVDAEGIPQMGALVQLLFPDATPAATAYTDSNGRYHVSDLRPGRYRVRVSAALFLPAVRQTLQVGANSRAVVNLTLSTLLAPTQWLPSTRRTSDTAEDDWMWTLRSSSIRPVLRMDSEGNATLGVSSSSQERSRVQSLGRVAIFANDGGFAHGGNHEVLTMERSVGNGSGSVLRADFSGPRVPFPVAPSAEVSAGWGRQLPFGGSSRTVVSYLSHPELLNGQGSNGMQAMVLRNAERMELGDTLRVDAGSTARAFNLAGNAIAMEPFLRVAYRAGSDVVIAYAFTASRGISQMEDLDRVAAPLPLAVQRHGHLRLSGGHANSISAAVRT
ncbi:MAG: carboxypeptidase regulatory-like domain-containing protein, partial [Terriglobus roseus]|nr:carboxypeptidase regulatory-like domain-containing protein [Terriglobus roseus]